MADMDQVGDEENKIKSMPISSMPPPQTCPPPHACLPSMPSSASITSTHTQHLPVCCEHASFLFMDIRHDIITIFFIIHRIYICNILGDLIFFC